VGSANFEGDHIVLGGVSIPHSQGLEAHSDGDVLLHALCDALLGAIAAGDIGHHFPDTDSAWAGADSRQLLQHVYQLIKEKGFVLVNCDATIIAQAPKMAPHILAMRTNIAEDLLVSTDRISVKATRPRQMRYRPLNKVILWIFFNEPLACF